MISAEEVVARRVVPTLRAAVAQALDQRRFTERQIAEALGITQSAVSKYLHGRTRTEEAVLRAEVFAQLIDRLAAGFGDGSLSQLEALGLTHAAIRKEERRGVVCALHEEEVPALRGLACDLCVTGGRAEFLAEEEALADVRLALRTLERDERFARLIPSVGTNVARAKRGAMTTQDVAAVPGRIFEMHGRARVPAPPEFGASRHVAEVVLAVFAVFPEQQAAINVRADRAALAAAAALKWKTAPFSASYEGRAERIAATLRKQRRAPRAVFHRGAFGIEPIMYVLGATAQEAAEAACRLAGALP